MQNDEQRTLRLIRFWLVLLIIGLVVSGVTAYPLLHELELLCSWLGALDAAATQSGLNHWLLTVREGLRATYATFPWIAYGTDWLAFAHLAIAIFFIGPLVNPLRNIWILYAGLIACMLVLPEALITGHFRGIPFGWRIIDCSFGVFGALPLLYCIRLTKRLKSAGSSSTVL